MGKKTISLSSPPRLCPSAACSREQPGGPRLVPAGFQSSSKPNAALASQVPFWITDSPCNPSPPGWPLPLTPRQQPPGSTAVVPTPWGQGRDAPWGLASAKGRGALPGPSCYQACLHKLIRANWLLGKSSLQELCKKDFEVGLRMAKRLFKHSAMQGQAPGPGTTPCSLQHRRCQ